MDLRGEPQRATSPSQSQRWHREQQQAIEEDWSHDPDVMTWLAAAAAGDCELYRRPTDGNPGAMAGERIGPNGA